MIGLNNRIKAFVLLSDLLLCDDNQFNDDVFGAKSKFDEACKNAIYNNVWFTESSIKFAVGQIGEMLKSDNLAKWIDRYSINKDYCAPKTIGVVMAGNIPLVGFHDFLCVLMSGHRFLGKLSHNDPYLLPALSKLLCAIEPRFEDFIAFTDNTISGFDAVIATGSDNTSRYFDYYFSKYPNIIRRNRNSVAVLRGDESPESLSRLADDVFLYFGLGCRSVSFLLVPENYDFTNLFEAFSKYEYLATHARYFNNYEYNKAVCLVNNVKHYDNGFIIVRESDVLASPVATLHFKRYDNLSDVVPFLQCNDDLIQCVVSENSFVWKSFDFGAAQTPSLSDYADGIDTMKFLANIQHFDS